MCVGFWKWIMYVMRGKHICPILFIYSGGGAITLINVYFLNCPFLKSITKHVRVWESIN